MISKYVFDMEFNDIDELNTWKYIITATGWILRDRVMSLSY
jgi:hypothetical protein